MTDSFPDSPPGILLRRIVCVDDDAESLERIRQACAAIKNWNRLIDLAENHGLAPWLHRQIAKAGIEIPTKPHRQLRSLTLRHRDSNRIRDRALVEMLNSLESRGIEVVVLKGAALAHLVYEQPGLRPMSDIDVLVSPKRLDDAADALRNLGYEETRGTPAAADHHHLPALSRASDGLSISVEIHHDALARDNIGSIRMDNLSEPARALRIDDDTTGHALGHIDMLRHLWRHALQPRETTKLGSALDIVLYTSCFAEQIDWPRIEAAFPEILTGLSLLGLLVPLPRAVAERVPEPASPPPEGIGRGMIPLSRIRHRQNRLEKMLAPPEWWLRAFYNVPPGRSLAVTRSVRHPARLLFWLWRRVGR